MHFINHVITKAKVLLSQAYMTLAVFGYSVFLAPKDFQIICVHISILSISRYGSCALN